MWKWFKSKLTAAFTPPAVPSTDVEMGTVESEIDADIVETAGKLAVVEALRLWSLDIEDPRHTNKTAEAERWREIIDDIVRGSTGAGWGWLDRYKGDGAVGNTQWCGMFAAKCWSAWTPLDLRKTWFPSTYRLDLWARYEDLSDLKHKNPRPKSGPFRLYARFDEHAVSTPFEPQAGDILLVGDGRPGYGDHVCLVERYDAKKRMFYTVEGNGVGRGPKGNRRQGIVRAERPLGAKTGHGYIARRLIRLSPTDLLP